jgi:hypothetical protein
VERRQEKAKMSEARTASRFRLRIAVLPYQQVTTDSWRVQRFLAEGGSNRVIREG